MTTVARDGQDADEKRKTERAFLLKLWGAILLLCALTLAAILYMNGGYFTFSLDDPYIHLATAQQILHGHYGINTQEPAAAASSILYPFLLVPFLALGFGQYSALLINILAALGAGILAVRLFREASLPVARLPNLLWGIVSALLSFGLILLIFMGLEHTLQIAVTLACLWGLWRFLEHGQLSAWWVAALVTAPLVRYEGAALLAAGVLILVLRREWKWAAVTFLAGFGLLAGFSLFLTHLGLSPLPSSVLVKSTGAANSLAGGLAGLIAAIGATLGANLQNPRAFPLLMGLILTIWPFLDAVRRSGNPADWPARALTGLFCALVIAAQLALGAFEWYPRYEAYALVIAAFGAILVYRDTVARALSSADERHVAYFSAGMALLFIRTVTMFFLIPQAANNIYEQQYQMHRFITGFYRAPVAVNDLGWVSYDNPHYVLDLLGLGSETARRARLAHPGNAAWMQQFAVERDVELAMIYPEWFGQVPCEWVPLGALWLSGSKVSVPVDHVTFYAIPPGDPETMRTTIRRFAATLPKGVRFDFVDPSAQSAFCRK